MNKILETLKNEQQNKIKNGLYHYTQILFAYNSNHIEGSTLTEEQTRCIFETKTFLPESNQVIKTNDILETLNHFQAFDYILETVDKKLDNEYIKNIHYLVKKECSDILTIGDFKRKQNFVGNIATTAPENVATEMQILLSSYNLLNKNSIENLVNFHFNFEKIHPFEDGNGRVGRLLMFKECLKANIVPFIIDEEHKLFYYRGLKEYEQTKGYLIDTCLSCQDKYKEILNYFQVEFGIENLAQKPKIKNKSPRI